MSTSWCPYCNNVRSLLLGQVYCSRQHQPMGALNTGTLFIKTKKMEETDDHVSRLSIRCVLNGEQRYVVGGTERLISPQKYVIVNQGQHYRTSLDSAREQEMILVAFKPGFAEALLHSLQTTSAELLDNPFCASQPADFFEHTYPADPIIAAHFSRLRSLLDEPQEEREQVDTDSIYEAILTRMFILHQQIQPQVCRLSFVNRSTREELYRRLHTARDYMEANVAKSLTLEQIARVACLSVHHFKRTYRDLFGITPHQALLKMRMEKATALCREGTMSVSRICEAVGFENTSSFIRAFKAHTGKTPGAYSC